MHKKFDYRQIKLIKNLTIDKVRNYLHGKIQNISLKTIFIIYDMQILIGIVDDSLKNRATIYHLHPTTRTA